MLDKTVPFLLIVFVVVVLMAMIMGTLAQDYGEVTYLRVEEHRVECVLRGSALSCNWYDGGRGK